MRRTPTQDHLVVPSHPTVAPSDGRAVGCELRWQCPEWGLSYPESSQPTKTGSLQRSTSVSPNRRCSGTPDTSPVLDGRLSVRRRRQCPPVLPKQELKGANDEH